MIGIDTSSDRAQRIHKGCVEEGVQKKICRHLKLAHQTKSTKTPMQCRESKGRTKSDSAVLFRAADVLTTLQRVCEETLLYA